MIYGFMAALAWIGLMGYLASEGSWLVAMFAMLIHEITVSLYQSKMRNTLRESKALTDSAQSMLTQMVGSAMETNEVIQSFVNSIKKEREAVEEVNSDTHKSYKN